MSSKKAITVRIGTRGSTLARWQANWVAAELGRRYQHMEFSLVTLSTKGDTIVDAPLSGLGGKGLFVREIDEALLAGRIDLAVHSMKDLPAEIPDGIQLVAVPPREDPRDVIISADGLRLEELPRGATVGTSSLRRRAQLLHIRPDLNVVDLRGNVDTRLRKLRQRQGGLQAIVLAAAGIKRMGLWDQVTEVLEPEGFLPAIGQGALAVEARSQDQALQELLQPIDDPKSRAAVTAERALMAELQGGCQVPMAALATVALGGQMTLRGMVADLGGEPLFRAQISGDMAEARELGVKMARVLAQRGAREVLDKLRSCLPGTSSRRS